MLDVFMYNTLPQFLSNACAEPGNFTELVQARLPENSLDKVLVFFLLVLNLFYSLQRGSIGVITEKTILFQGSRGGPTFTGGGGGVQMLISIES